MNRLNHSKTSVEVVIPVYNEEYELKRNIIKLYNYLKNNAKYSWIITIADNASTDKTQEIGKRLARAYQNLDYIRIPKKGRGRAVKKVWLKSKADILAYMDIDLSTDLSHLSNIVKKLTNGSDIAIGSRLLSKSIVLERSTSREIISRGLNLLIKIMFQTKFSDAQCGFKAITKKTASEILPYIEDNGWFMDSELLIIAEKAGYTIYEEPVKWIDNPGSTVRVLPTAWGDFKGLMRLLITKPWKMIQFNHG